MINFTPGQSRFLNFFGLNILFGNSKACLLVLTCEKLIMDAHAAEMALGRERDLAT